MAAAACICSVCDLHYHDAVALAADPGRLLELECCALPVCVTVRHAVLAAALAVGLAHAGTAAQKRFATYKSLQTLRPYPVELTTPVSRRDERKKYFCCVSSVVRRQFPDEPKNNRNNRTGKKLACDRERGDRERDRAAEDK